MKNVRIKLAYRMVIHHQSPSTWEKYVWESTYQEFKMQVPRFNDAAKPLATFKQLLSANPKADQLHYLVGIAAQSYLLQWNGTLYPLLDNLGKPSLPFEQYRLDIIDSHIHEPTLHTVALTFISPILTLLDIWDGHYLIALGDQSQNIATGVETLMFKMQPALSVAFYQV